MQYVLCTNKLLQVQKKPFIHYLFADEVLCHDNVVKSHRTGFKIRLTVWYMKMHMQDKLNQYYRYATSAMICEQKRDYPEAAMHWKSAMKYAWGRNIKWCEHRQEMCDRFATLLKMRPL